MISNNPIQNYDKLSVNLAVRSFYKTDASLDLNIALSAVPTKITNNEVNTLNNENYTFYRGSLNELIDPQEQDCVNQLIILLQKLIDIKGW